MHLHAPFRSSGLHNNAITQRTFIEGLNGLLNAPVYRFDNDMFIIHPIDLHDPCSETTTKVAKDLESYGVWTPNEEANNQLVGLTIGNLHGSYVTGNLTETVYGTRGKDKLILPEAFELFLSSNTFFVWNRERLAEYFEQYLGYEMKSNFISIEGLLQLANIHLGCIMRAASVDEAETEEIVQLICARPTMYCMCTDEMRPEAALKRLAEMTAIGANMLAHVLMVVVQIYAPNRNAPTTSKWVRQQIDLLQCQMKIDPNTLLFEESICEDESQFDLGKRLQLPDLMKHAPKVIAIQIMKGRKSNREQVLLGSGSDEYCDYMYIINKMLSESKGNFNWEQRAAMRAQIFANLRKEILTHCSELRRCGYYNHPSVEVVVAHEDEYNEDGDILPTACSSLVMVLAHE